MAVTLKRVSVVYACPRLHQLPIPIHCQEPPHLQTQHVPIHDYQVPLPFQCVVGLMNIKKDILHHFLAHSGNILGRFLLQGGRPRAPLFLQPMQ